MSRRLRHSLTFRATDFLERFIRDEPTADGEDQLEGEDLSIKRLPDSPLTSRNLIYRDVTIFRVYKSGAFSMRISADFGYSHEHLSKRVAYVNFCLDLLSMPFCVSQNEYLTFPGFVTVAPVTPYRTQTIFVPHTSIPSLMLLAKARRPSLSDPKAIRQYDETVLSLLKGARLIYKQEEVNDEY